MPYQNPVNIAAANRLFAEAMAGPSAFRDTVDFIVARYLHDDPESVIDRVTARINRDKFLTQRRECETLPEERRQHLLGLSTLGRRVQRTEATDVRFRRAKRDMEMDAERGKIPNNIIRENGERSRANS